MEPESTSCLAQSQSKLYSWHSYNSSYIHGFPVPFVVSLRPGPKLKVLWTFRCEKKRRKGKRRKGEEREDKQMEDNGRKREILLLVKKQSLLV